MPDADHIYIDAVGELYAFIRNGQSEFLWKMTLKKKMFSKNTRV